MKLFYFTALSLVFIFSNVAKGDQFQTYEIKYLPYAKRDCANIIAQTKTKFESSTSKKVVTTSCEETKDVGLAIALTYQSEFPLEFNSTYLGVFWSKGAPSPLNMPMWGLYENLVDCYLDLSDQIQIFQDQTGIPSIAAGCDKASESKYFLRIDGYGASNKYFYESKIEFRGDTDKALLTELASVFASKGAIISYKIPWGPNAVVGYYASQLIYPRVVNLGIASVLLKRECEFELANLKQVFAAQGITGMFAMRCLADSSFNQELFHLNFGVPENAKLNSFWMSREFKFNKFSDCLTQKQNSITAYKDVTGRNVWGAICHRFNDLDPEYTLSFYGN